MLAVDTIWIGDSMLAKLHVELLTVLSTTATATGAVKIGSAIYLPTLRNAVKIAHQSATVDQLSGGRLEFDVGVRSDIKAE
jgi:alkanesulfonate monooxygenase SsuD/methylene tetrahydromethanopterin reductase-like flavin-dependent oxidoreductase (luciferase family)